jgi:hypothetical protein
VPILDRIEAAGRDAWLRFVKWLNGIALSLIGAVGSAYSTYPDSTKAFLRQLPEWLVFPAAIVFCLVINHALKRAKNAS